MVKCASQDRRAVQKKTIRKGLFCFFFNNGPLSMIWVQELILGRIRICKKKSSWPTVLIQLIFSFFRYKIDFESEIFLIDVKSLVIFRKLFENHSQWFAEYLVVPLTTYIPDKISWESEFSDIYGNGSDTYHIYSEQESVSRPI